MEIKNFDQLNQVTPLSKYLAATLFILMPFIGGYIGYTLAPVKVIEVGKLVMADPQSSESDLSNLFIATTTIVNNDVEATFSDGSIKVIAQGLDAEDVSDIQLIETYLEAFISPDARFVALQAIGFEDYFVNIYNVDTGMFTEKIYGEVMKWTDDGRLEIKACNLAGEECREMISRNAKNPGVMEEMVR
ncbi:MAG: hypothetical protein V4606_02225 [Patescibacteria group bacterium]